MILNILTETNNILYREPFASVINAVIWGRSINHLPEIWNDLRLAGLLHLLVLSGTNITLLITFLHKTLFFIRIKLRTILIIFAIIFYLIICGLTPSLVRATFFGIANCLGILFGRKVYLAYSLLLSFFLIAIFKVDWLTSISFQLSYFASLGMLLFSDDLKIMMRKIPLIRDELAISISAQLGVMPILLYYFGSFSFFAPISNLLVFWTIVPLTTIGLGVQIIYILTNYRVDFLIFINILIMKYVLFIANILGNLSWSNITFGL